MRNKILNLNQTFLFSVFPTGVPTITEVISAKGTLTDFHPKINQVDQEIKNPQNFDGSLAHITNNANDERHVKFNLEDDLRSESETDSKQNSTRSHDTTITMQCE